MSLYYEVLFHNFQKQPRITKHKIQSCRSLEMEKDSLLVWSACSNTSDTLDSGVVVLSVGTCPVVHEIKKIINSGLNIYKVIIFEEGHAYF